MVTRLRRDAFLIPADQGARILTNSGTESLTGPTIYQWIDKLAPYLDGRRSVAELTRPLPDEKRGMVERIVATLLERGLIRHGAEDPHNGEVGYLDSFVPKAHETYRNYRHARICVLGSGPLHTALVEVLVRSGADPRTGIRPEGELVIHLVDEADHGRGIAKECRRLGIPLVQAIPLGEELWVYAGSDAVSAWRRLDRWSNVDDPVHQSPPPEAVAVAASMVGQAAFRLLTGVAAPAEATTMTCLHLVSLRTSTHRFLPLPDTVARTDREAFLATMARLDTAPPLDPDSLDTEGSALRDARIGVLGELSERDYVQLPLNVTAATVAGRARPVLGAGLSVTQARWQAVLAGIAAHAVSTMDHGQVWARRLADGTARLVDAAAVFTARNVGAVARYSWSEAVSAGLFECTAMHTAAHPGPVTRLDPMALDHDEQAGAYRTILRILEVPLEIYDVTGPLRAPTLAFRAGQRTITYVSAPRPADALADGLRAVALDEQSRRNGQPDYAPPEVPQLVVTNTRTGEPPASVTEPEVIDAMVAHGLDPVVVPLNHDPEVGRIMPFVARVVILDD